MHGWLDLWDSSVPTTLDRASCGRWRSVKVPSVMLFGDESSRGWTNSRLGSALGTRRSPRRWPVDWSPWTCCGRNFPSNSA